MNQTETSIELYYLDRKTVHASWGHKMSQKLYQTAMDYPTFCFLHREFH